MSSTEPALTLLPSVPTGAPAPAWTWPKAPNRTLPSERPMASLISLVSSVPEAPTSVPATISAKLPSTNPPAATASPVKAFSIEITTGMSAPPMGRTKATPSRSARASSGMKVAGEELIASTLAASPRMTTAIRPLTSCWPG